MPTDILKKAFVYYANGALVYHQYGGCLPMTAWKIMITESYRPMKPRHKHNLILCQQVRKYTFIRRSVPSTTLTPTALRGSAIRYLTRSLPLFIRKFSSSRAAAALARQSVISRTQSNVRRPPNFVGSYTIAVYLSSDIAW